MSTKSKLFQPEICVKAKSLTDPQIFGLERVKEFFKLKLGENGLMKVSVNGSFFKILPQNLKTLLKSKYVVYIIVFVGFNVFSSEDHPNNFF